jgi:small-conductance mechanosensitive channel
MNWINLKSITAIAVAALAAGTGTHLIQQREANRLRNENQNLVAQQEQSTTDRDTALSAAIANKDELERLRKDQSELLRLRNEVGQLRRRAKETEQLAEQNRQLQDALAKRVQNVPRTEAETETDPEKSFAIERMNRSKHLVLGLIMYAGDNQDMLPTDLNSISNYLGSVASEYLLNNPFELVLQGAITNIANPSATLAVREKQAWTAKGKWFKTYGFADGHSEVHTEPDGNFEAWEKQRMLIQPSR